MKTKKTINVLLCASLLTLVVPAVPAYGNQYWDKFKRVITHPITLITCGIAVFAGLYCLIEQPGFSWWSNSEERPKLPSDTEKKKSTSNQSKNNTQMFSLEVGKNYITPPTAPPLEDYSLADEILNELKTFIEEIKKSPQELASNASQVVANSIKKVEDLKSNKIGKALIGEFFDISLTISDVESSVSPTISTVSKIRPFAVNCSFNKSKELLMRTRRFRFTCSKNTGCSQFNLHIEDLDGQTLMLDLERIDDLESEGIKQKIVETFN